MPTRQERRRQERLAKKQGKEPKRYDKDGNEIGLRQWADGKGKEKIYEMNIEMIQPWAVPVFKTTLPPDVLQTMIEISDKVIVDKNAESWGKNLAGQIDTELLVEHDILEQTGVMGFFLGAVRQFVLMCKCQQMPEVAEAVQREEWLPQMLSCWIISQYPNEYNPAHLHTQCQISSVMYLKVPEMIPSRKEHRAEDDGSILFFGNASRDIDLSVPQMVCQPNVGDFYVFGAHQQHAVYPYRCAEGQKETERRSISFNAVFQSKTDYDRGKENEVPQAAVRPGESRPT